MAFGLGAGVAVGFEAAAVHQMGDYGLGGVGGKKLRDRLTRHPDRPPGAAGRKARENLWPSPHTIPPTPRRISECALRCLQ